MSKKKTKTPKTRKRIKLRHATIVQKHQEQRAQLNYPRISLRSLFYTLKIYHKAVGWRSFFFALYRLYNSVLPSITAVLAGAAVTAIADAINTHDFVPTIVYLSILLGIQVADIILGAIDHYLSSRAYQEVYIYVSERVATKYIQIPLRIRETREFADKFDRVKSFANSIPFISSSIIGVTSSIISLISIIIATLTVSPIITGVVILSAIPSSIITMKLSAKRRRNWREYTRDRRIAWTIENKIINSNNALEIEMNGLGGYLVKRMVKANRHSQEQDIIDERRYFWPRFGSNLLEILATFGILFYVAIEIILGRLAIGQFFTIRTLLSQLSANITGLFDNLSSVSENLVNATDYMEFMEAAIKPSGEVKVTDTPTIEFRNVSFSYPNSNVKALDNVSFKLKPGESLAIVGENGAGKTTLIKLLIGAYEPAEGVILINGQPFSQIDRESYLSQLGALFQDYSRYEFATLGENVWFGDTNKEYNQKALELALEQADLNNLASNYDKGLNQILSKDFDESSTTDLSGGQWQRLAIARVLFRSPNVLLLDEPTSAIDAKSEHRILRNVFERQKGKTTVIISHRFSTVRKASQIIVLDHGKVIESGSHEELVAKDGGTYKTMFETQAKEYR